jgi:hypothetical protein
MTYTLEIEVNDLLEDAIDGVLGEVEEAIENIRTYGPDRRMHRVDVDVDELLAEHRAVAVVWDIRHVKDIRPDLGDEEAWDVLQGVRHDRLNDPMLEAIRQEAETLYPRRRQSRPAQAGQVIAGYGAGDERENLVDLLTDAMHWCEEFGEPFEEFCGTARMHFAEESKSSRKGA